MSTGPRTARTYELQCVDCDFERTFEGDVFEVLDVVDAHQEDNALNDGDHFVEFECEEARRSGEEARRTGEETAQATGT